MVLVVSRTTTDVNENEQVPISIFETGNHLSN